MRTTTLTSSHRSYEPRSTRLKQGRYAGLARAATTRAGAPMAATGAGIRR
ncbi:hypothetical protein [Nocardioides sp. CER19]|nr:hypothetical protein [Nocardioides sp. CER19]MDH2413393.1 hypothetical protein [Nocardioides sp. CER19]